MNRNLDWDGCSNVRDLGGLAAAQGARTRWAAIVRADNVGRLAAAGWAALEAHGVRTVVDLRNDDEIGADVAPRPEGITTLRVPIDDVADAAFWARCWAGGLDGSPLYYGPFLEQKASRCVDALTAIARAAPGGVVVHCGIGRDRTGLVSALALALAGVAPDAIAADYDASRSRVASLLDALGCSDQLALIEAQLARRNTTARELMIDLFTRLDVEAHLRAAGMRGDDLAALRARLVARSTS